MPDAPQNGGLEKKNKILKALDALAGIADGLSQRRGNELKKSIRALREQYSDPEFRLAVIGNFSCGKSTFLNAMLKRELLSVSNLPTTAVPTYIRWNRSQAKRRLKEAAHAKRGRQAIFELASPNDPIITVTIKGGRPYTLCGELLDAFIKETGIQAPREIGKQIDYLTTTTALCGQIESVELSFPDEERYKNFCLIDTPGVNPGDEASQSHIVQTQTVLREKADAAIILYPLKDAMSRDLQQFMEENAPHLMKNAIVLLTKIDIASPGEWEKVLKRTRELVGARFGQENPTVYGISAGNALDAEVRNDTGKLAWYDLFNNTMQSIFTSLRIRRDEITTDRLSALLHETISTTQEYINKDTADIEKEQQKLTAYSLKSLRIALKRMYDQYELAIGASREQRHRVIQMIVYQCVNIRQKNAVFAINSLKNMQSVKRYIANDYPKLMEGIDAEINATINSRVVETLRQKSVFYAIQVEDCLVEYSRLVGSVNTRAALSDETLVTKLDNSQVRPVATSGGTAAAWGAVGGTILAFAVAPLLGPLVWLGGWIWDGYHFEENRAKAIADLTDRLSKYRDDVVKMCTQNIDSAVEGNLKWANGILDTYAEQYKELFTKAEEGFTKREREAARQIANNQNTVRQLKSIQETL